MHHIVVMNRTTQNAPFGTDNTPALQLKIVGGKRVEILANKNASDQNSRNNKFENKGSPQRGPHGTPSMLTQPIFRDYEYADLQRGYHTAKQHEIAREVTSYTSPFGDRTQSFRHGVPAINKHPVLPPIGISQPPGNVFVPDMISKEELTLNSRHDYSDAPLETMIANKLKGFRPTKIKDMYIELTGFDRKLTGLISEAQLSLVALRNDLPLKLSTLKLLFNKFSDPNDPREINYEKLLQFLASCMAQGLPSSAVSKSASGFSSSPEESKTPPVLEHVTPPSVHATESDYRPGSPVDEKLVSLLKEQLMDFDDLNVEALKDGLTSTDRLGNGELRADDILRVCVNHRLPLTSSVLTRMLQEAEIANGIVDWHKFLAPLACADRRLHPAHSGTSQSIAPKSSRAAQDRKSQVKSRNDDEMDFESKSQHGRPSAGNTNERNVHASNHKTSLRDHLSAGWDEKERNAIRKSSLKTSSEEEEEDRSPRRTEMWMRNFTRLAHALRSYHPFKSDHLPRAEVQRMVTNYNLIYSLGFSQARLANAVERAVTSNSKEGKEQSVSVNRLLDILCGK